MFPACRLFGRLLFVLTLSLSGMPLTAQAENVQLLIQEYAPFTHTKANKEIGGFLSDKIQEIMKRSGETSSIQSTSLARALSATQNNADTCMIGLRRTPDRENSFAWVGPLVKDEWVLYGKKTNSRKLSSFEDAKTYRIGSYKNAATGLQLAEQGYKIEFASEDDDNPRLLANERIDYWVVSRLHGMVMAQQQGYWPEISNVASYKNIELYMLCNARMDKQRIDNFNRFNKEIDNDGTMDKILRKYGVR